MNKIISTSANIAISLFLLLYFIALISFSYFNMNTKGFNVVFELITIPLLLVICGMLVYNFLNWKKEKWRLNASHFFPLSILIICVLILIFASIYNI